MNCFVFAFSTFNNNDSLKRSRTISPKTNSFIHSINPKTTKTRFILFFEFRTSRSEYGRRWIRRRLSQHVCIQHTTSTSSSFIDLIRLLYRNKTKELNDFSFFFKKNLRTCFGNDANVAVVNIEEKCHSLLLCLSFKIYQAKKQPIHRQPRVPFDQLNRQNK